FWFWRRQMLRGGHSPALIDKFLVWGVVATFAGARLGHCLFYEPERFLADPVSILFFWQGGLASHGATIGLTVALILFARKNHLRVLELTDRFAMSAAVAAAGIRMGNFLNSEIVGRASSVPWAVRFTHYQDHGAVARHPSQLYEFALGLGVLLALYLADRWAGREKRPLGMMTGLFLTLYFAGRFGVEFFKEFQVGPWESVVTMGQILSLIPLAAGVGLLIWAWRRRVPTTLATEPAPVEQKRRRRR
ncbi:MAG: prolipoprotein diacylglyceryl transferase, partial [Planctomycetaceae bacterium]|nr:prolipoprotein diacylglyceryl transferase [Planctomycetaceae bacterium]